MKLICLVVFSVTCFSLAGCKNDRINGCASETNYTKNVELQLDSKSEDPDLNIWVGKYKFGESTGYPNETDIAPVSMEYEIQIYQEDTNYYANINIDGQMTMAHGKALVYGDESWISLVFLEYLPEHSAGGFMEKGDNVLISFRREGDAIYTYWGEIYPILNENEESGKIYFTQIE